MTDSVGGSATSNDAMTSSVTQNTAVTESVDYSLQSNIMPLVVVKIEKCDIEDMPAPNIEINSIKPKEEEIKEKKTLGESLIISHEYDFDISNSMEEKVLKNIQQNISKEDTSKDTSAEIKNETVDKTEKPKQNVGNPKCLWVANISDKVSAKILKKHFSDQGNVVSAKILTNGKSLFGYVILADTESAANCARFLNNTILEGDRISVTKTRPDWPKKQPLEPGKKSREIIKTRLTKTESKESKCSLTKKHTSDDEKGDDPSKGEVDWHAEYQKYKFHYIKTHRRLLEACRRNESLERKCVRLSDFLKSSDQRLRIERTRFFKEKLFWERKHNIISKKLEDERKLINREWFDIRRLRENLTESRINRNKSRSISSHRTSHQIKRFSEKKGDDDKTPRTPPPPKVNGKKRSVDSRNQIYDGKKDRRSSPLTYSFNDVSSRIKQEHRSSSQWSSNNYDNQWRMSSDVHSGRYQYQDTSYNHHYYRSNDYMKYDSRKY